MGRASDPAKRIKELAKLVSFHNDCYFNKDEPQISDAEYDGHYKELLALEKRYPQFLTPDSPTQVIGGKAGGGFAQIRHRTPMLSLEKAHELKDLERFWQRMGKDADDTACMAVPKLDGVAVSLVYAAGKISYGATRGDGQVGENITANLLQIPGIPKKLPKKIPRNLELRGEVVMSDEAFAKLNEQQRQDEQKEFVNPRNAAAGIVRQLHADVKKLAHLEFFAYWAFDENGDAKPTAQETFDMMRTFTKVTEPAQLVRDIAEFTLYQQRLESDIKERGLNADGIVLRLNDNIASTAMGSNAKSPRAAIAYKFAATEAQTAIEGVRYQIGRSGVVTPVGKLEPVQVGGVTVSSVTLHNCRMMQQWELHEGDQVVVIRSGDVIPKLVRLLPEERRPGAQPFKLPSACPACDSPLSWQSINLVCKNKECPGKQLHRFSHFVSRKAMDIEGFGDKMLANLVGNVLVRRPADLFGLTSEQLTGLERVAEKSAANLIASLERARSTTLARVLNALGLPGLGETGASALALAFGNLENLAFALPETLCFIKPVQLEIARNVHESLNAEAGEEVKLMREHKVTWQERQPSGLRATILDVLTHVAYLRSVDAHGNAGDGDGGGPDLFSEESDGWPAISASFLLKLGQAENPPVTLADLDSLSEEDCVAISANKKLGGQAYQALRQLLDSARFQDFVGDLQSRLAIEWGEAKAKTAVGALAGKSVVITGSLPGMNRSEAQGLVAKHGGNAATSVTGNTDLLVTGDKHSKAKVEKAVSIGVKVIGGEEFLASLGQERQ